MTMKKKKYPTPSTRIMGLKQMGILCSSTSCNAGAIKINNGEGIILEEETWN